MRDDYEFGQCRSFEDGVVRCFEIHYLEPDVLCSVVFCGPKGNCQNHLSDGYSRVARDDPIEQRVRWGEHIGDVEAHLLQSLGEQYIETATTIDEYFSKSGASNKWIHDERIPSWV